MDGSCGPRSPSRDGQGQTLTSAVFRPCCRPENSDRSWSTTPDLWGPSIINREEFPAYFDLRIEAYICQVSVHGDNDGNLMALRKNMWRMEGVSQHALLLKLVDTSFIQATSAQDQGEGVAQQFPATGLFDEDYHSSARPQKVWAMCVSEDEGLLLEDRGSLDDHRVFKRLGVFVVDRKQSFYPSQYVHHTPHENLAAARLEWSTEYTLDVENLPKETVILR
jgi:hypothetical protein